MGRGSGAAGNSTPGSATNNQVYYDSNGLYTNPTLSLPMMARAPMANFYGTNNYFQKNQQTQKPSIINDLIQQAMNAQANAPTMGQLFPGSLGGLLGNGGYSAQGQYGAGRFLGSPIMGNPSLTATQSTNTTT
jgi:hypothetical protein